MKHQSKQALAWVLAIGASSAVYGGGTWWLKKLASRAPSSSHEQEDSTGHAEAAHAPVDHPQDESSAAAPHSPAASDEPAKPADSTHHDTKATPKDHSDEKASHSGTQNKKDPAHPSEKHANEPSSHGKGSHWSYAKSAADGPSHWGNLSATFAQCEKGREQSPIDLKGAVTRASAPKITWSYNPVAVSVENNGHTIVANMPNAQNHIAIDGETYELAQFHFHNPSEHKIGGIPSDMELHFVHKNAKGGLAVIGVMLNEKAGTENPFLKPLWQIMPRESHVKAEAKPTINLAKLLPTHRDFFHYAGSLTTPPCSQGVRWFVLKEPITLSGSQVDLYSGIFGGPTNRPVQPLFGREVIQSFGPTTVAH